MPPSVTIPVTRVPTITVSSIRGALSESALSGALPVPSLSACLTTPRGGTLRMSVSIDRRGRVRATPSAGTFRHAATITCLERAIESLTMSPEAGPTRARLEITIPAAAP